MSVNRYYIKKILQKTFIEKRRLLSSLDAGNAVSEGIHKAAASKKCPVDIKVFPLADGGEGTAQALIDGLNGINITQTVAGPAGRPVAASYGFIPAASTAVIEIAAAAGLPLMQPEDNPLYASTYGIGELIIDAVKKGARNFIIGLGGSATNDGGMGMLAALGYRFFDIHGNLCNQGAVSLKDVYTVDNALVLPELSKCHFNVACDVKNPLCGINGATYIYGPQKGLSAEQLGLIDAGMASYADAINISCNKHMENFPGAGAAGGLGFAFLSCLNSRLLPGAGYVMEMLGMKEELTDADWLVTGEGCLDAQSSMGKAPTSAALLAKSCNTHIKTLALAGSVNQESKKCHDFGIDAYFSILPSPMDLKDAMNPQTAGKNLSLVSEELFRLLL